MVLDSHIFDQSEDFAKRMGKASLEVRQEKEQSLVERRGLGQKRGLFRLDAYVDFYALIRFCLKVTGLWSRAVRNYLDIKVVQNEVLLDRLPAEFDGFRIAQLTDLHADLHEGFAAKVREVVSRLECDILVVTGDFRTCVFGDHTGATRASIDILKELHVPCYAILGNHDFLVKVPALEAAGIQFLLNEHVVIERGGAQLYVVGIDDPSFYRTHDFEHALKEVPSDACKLLLSHSPQVYRKAQSLGFDLQLSGHTHGGQICLPGGIPLVHDGMSPRHLLSGAWTVGQLHGYTSRGTGASGLPARLNCPAEVTVHTLRKCGA